MASKYTGRAISMFMEAWLLLGVARLMLLFRPFNKILPVLKSNNTIAIEANTATLQLVKLSIARACVRSPWRTKCFEQALAARMMLKRRGIATATYFGVLKSEGEKMEAHAWLKCNEFVVTGWRNMKDYIVVGIF